MACRLLKESKIYSTTFLKYERYLSVFSHRYSADASVKRFDLVVIGGGSGGLACAKEAASFDKRVAVLDYVDPSPQGTTWGLGGTCVNVGCIPKKLMHQAALLGQAVRDAKKFGWSVPDEVHHSWEELSTGVQGYVKSLNWGHRVALRSKKVDYINAKGFIEDPNTVIATTAKGTQETLKTEKIVIATGMRPKYPSEIPGALDYAISSDDIFWTKKAPGKTLCVGASYVSLEIAGFLTGLGFDTTVAIRSVPLRQFDQQMASLVSSAMSKEGTNIRMGWIPTSIAKRTDDKGLDVTFKTNTGESHVENFETVLMAVGRVPATSNLGLATKSVPVNLDDAGYVIGGYDNDSEKSSVPNIYAIGDVLKDQPELTPVAIRAGKLLAHRLFNNSNEQMDYHLVPTTVFTPLEYSFVGLSEEAAKAQYGDDHIETYHAYYKPLEYTVPQRHAEDCYIKVVTEKSDIQPVLGIHFTGPHAGEIMQGFAVAMRCGLTFKQLASTVGIHPTTAEELVKLRITKSSNEDPHVTGC